MTDTPPTDDDIATSADAPKADKSAKSVTPAKSAKADKGARAATPAKSAKPAAAASSERGTAGGAGKSATAATAARRTTRTARTAPDADKTATDGDVAAADGGPTPTDGEALPPLNREQRRAQKFHRKSGGRQDNLQTQRENNSGFLTTPPAPLEDGPNEAVATSTTQGPTSMTGPGTGGATESDERAPHHEGAHQGNPTKG